MNHRILIVDDDSAVRETLQLHLGRSGYDVTTVESAERALHIVGELDPALIITDVRMPGMSGLALVELLRERVPDLNVIVITAFEDMATTVRAMRAGACDYLVKPLDLDQLELVLERALRDRALRQRVRQVTEAESESVALHTLVGHTPAMIAIYKRIGALAGNRTPVLIRGETGTGKEVIARALHFNSTTAAEPFVPVNCTALPEPLLESELFGHVRGAFTGAIGDRRGRFEQAGRGTIFLDEIGDISPSFQAKLLRVLQEREFQPLGSERTRRTEARVIAATHRDLEARVREGTFREDLYFRLCVVELHVPPLRDRRDDIPLLVGHLTSRIGRELHKAPLVVPAATLRLLQDAPWPGNVRELENTLMRAAVLSPTGVLSPESMMVASSAPAGGGEPEGHLHSGQSLADAMLRHVRAVLARTGGNKRAAARILRISRQRLDRLLERGLAMAAERPPPGHAP